MALESGGRAPYTTAIAATTALDAWRDSGIGTPITPDNLARAGVPESIASRTLRSLTELELIDNNGQPTPTFEAFGQTRGDEEYRLAVQDWLRDVYADILTYGDPSKYTVDRVQEAFRTYEPAGQRKSMASLLVGLWRYAGLPVADDDGSTPRPPRQTTHRKKSTTRVSQSRGTGKSATFVNSGNLPPSLVGILQDMPSSGTTWTTKQREAFLKAFAATVDFLITVDDSPAPEVSSNGEDS